MDEIYDKLAERLVPTGAAMFSPNLKRLVGLAGPPGAGKSTLANEVARRVNRLWPQEASSFDDEVKPPDVAIVQYFPWMGSIYIVSNLMQWRIPKKPMREEEGSVYVPSFDHGVGDPVEEDIFVSLQHKVVIVEGNYVLLEEGSWKDISDMFDDKWFIDVNLDTAMQRVEDRHISTGKPPDVAKWRVDYNDRPNAELIIKSKTNADLLIRSINF